MVTLTERAAIGLEELLAANDVPPGHGVRLVPSGAGGIGMTIGAPDEGDEVIRRGDQPLLIVEGRIAEALTGLQVDCETSMVDGQPRTEFRIRPPG